MRLKKGDLVKVVSGSHKGSEGKILAVYPETHRVIVENVNVIKKAQRPTQDNPRGGFVEREAAIHASNVQILDPQTNQPSRIAYKIEGSSKIRVSAKSGAQLDN
ncbi:MAG: 50S ribosomal protein L24 [Trueperaceae bacterium]|nr:50S ribosomal protein L24 [Trueperaceae bacterium]